MPSAEIRPWAGADRQLLLEFAPEEVRDAAGPPGYDIPDLETYETLVCAKRVLFTAQNAQVRAVHSEAAEQLGVAWDKREATKGGGYVDVEPHSIYRPAVVKYVRKHPGQLVGALAMIKGIMDTDHDKRLMAHGFKVMELTEGAAELRLEANGRVEKGKTQPMKYFLPLLCVHAIKVARLYPRPEMADGLGVGLFGLYRRAWQSTGQDPRFAYVMGELQEQQDEAVNAVCTQAEKDPAILEYGEPPEIHDHLSVLARRELSLRFGALLGRPWDPLITDPILSASRQRIPVQRDGQAHDGLPAQTPRALAGHK